LSWLPPLRVRLRWGDCWLAYGDVVGTHIRRNNNFEQGEQSFLLQFLRPGMAILDVGAHQGLYSLLASKKVSPGGYVVAFEPSPRELRRLRSNLSLNQRRNVRVEPLALGSSEGTAELFVCLGQETGCNSLRPPAVHEPVRKVHVRVTSLDHYLQRTGISKVDFMKLDVEGAEREVLKGGNKLLSDFRPVILCELADVRTEPWGYRSVEIYEFLAALGYRWFSITPEGWLLSCPKKERFHENLLAVPDEKLRLVTESIMDKS
jgi:FkbM family methyltransferase